MSTFQDVPMWRFTDRMVRSGLVMAWRLATSPTSTSPDLAKPTTDGVVLPPSALGMTTGSPPSSTLTTELVVPRSIPTALAIVCSSVPLFSARPRGTSTDSVHLWHRSYLVTETSITKLSAICIDFLRDFTHVSWGPVGIRSPHARPGPPSPRPIDLERRESLHRLARCGSHPRGGGRGHRGREAGGRRRRAPPEGALR